MPDTGAVPDDRAEPPLPPATTQWQPTRSAADESAAPYAPFIASRVPPPVSVSRDEGPSLSDAAAAHPAETVMPWEEDIPARHESGPVVTAETPSAAAAPADVDFWAASLPEETGQAVPAWQDEVDTVADLAAPAAGRADSDNEDRDDVIVDAAEPTPEPSEAARAFPLDAFIIPEDSRRVPAGTELTAELQRQIAAELALRLESLASQLRAGGLDALLAPSQDHEPVDVVLAAVLSGYLARKAH